MSKTRKTAPFFVLERAPGWRHDFTEIHDHTDGICDLAAYLAGEAPGGPEHCYRTPNGIRHLCGCEGCTGRYWRRYRHRRARTGWRAELVRARQIVDRGDLDVWADDNPGW